MLSDYVGNAGIWRQIPSTTLHMHVLLNQHPSTSSYVGPSVSLNPRLGTCVPDKQIKHLCSRTETARHFPTIPPSPLPLPSHPPVFMAKSMTLSNGDVCCIRDWVLFSLSVPVDNTEAPAFSALRSSPVWSFAYFRLGPGPGLVQCFIN